MLDKRKTDVLYAIIESYMLTAEPVGSKTILEKYDLGVSSATIRNDMSFLEDLGLILKPHTSAGRIPSNKAYRYYVDRMLEDFDPSEMDDQDQPMLVGQDQREVEKFIRQTTKILSEITNLTALAVIANDADGIIKKVNLAKLEKNLYLVFVIFDANDIVHETIYLSKDLKDQDVALLNGLLSEFTDISLSNFSRLIAKANYQNTSYEELFDNLYMLLRRILKNRRKTKLIFDGISNIFHYPEYRDSEKAKEFIDFIEDTSTIKTILAKDLDKDLSINIGEENSDENLNDLTIISSSYGLFGNYGRLGIIGPTRMDYDNVVHTLLSITRSLKNA